MSKLMSGLNQRALDAGVPLSAHIDLTWACNERCIHCYLDHDDHTQLSLGEIRDLLDQLADAGVFFIIFSGGEIFLRKDLEDIVRHARLRGFDIKLKTNGILIRDRDVEWIRALGVHQVQISIYSHLASVHDGITKVRGSHDRSLHAIRMLRDRGLHVVIACVLMKPNAHDFRGVQELARELGAEFTVDPTITPHITGDRSILSLNIEHKDLEAVFRSEGLVGEVPGVVDEDVLNALPCSAGHTACYISPRGDLYPCVQFPIVCGNVRESRFINIWRNSEQLREVRSIRARDLTTCSSCGHVGGCSRCPGLAYMEGSMYGPSSADCEKSFVRTGVPSENMMRRGHTDAMPLVQIAIH